MTCPQCTFVNPPAMAFCGRCGTRLASLCLDWPRFRGHLFSEERRRPLEIRRRWLLTHLPLAILAVPVVGEAQEAGKVNRIGFLRIGPPPPAFIDGFRQRLRELGYVEGQNIAIEYGLAGTAAELPDFATKLVQRKVDVLVASGTPSVLPAKNVTRTIPVVFVAAIDPVAAGIIASLARPGGT